MRTRQPRQKRRPRVLRAVLALAVLITLVAIIGIGMIWQTFYRPDSDIAPGQSVEIEIPQGASTTKIAALLAEEGVVQNANMFRWDVKRAEADGSLRAGIYELSTGMPSDLVIEKLKRGPDIVYITVTIPEGFTVQQIAARLEKQVGIPQDDTLALALGGAGEFAKDHPYVEKAYRGSLEGFLFPKTYRIKEGTDARGALEMMLDQFDKEIAEVDQSFAKERGLDLPKLVTLASIVEREAGLDKERPLVSSVMYNRLKRGMRLQVCATIEYVLPGGKLRLTDEDLKTPSPYNTYLHDGLPPGPIASPGLASLKAAAEPAETDYLYYVLTGKDGSHTFATNGDDFLKAKQKSKEVFGQ